MLITEDGEPAPTLVDKGITSKAYTIALTEATDTAKIYTIYVQSQNTSQPIKTYKLHVTRRSGENDIISIKRGNVDATEEPVENSDDVKYIFFVDSMTEVPQITIETSPKSILRVGYYDSQNKWHNNGDSSASTAGDTAGWTTDNNWQDTLPANANGGKYVIEVKAENGSKKNYVLEFREKSDDTSIKSITTEKGLDGEYNVDMSMTVLYEANVPDHDTLLDILLTDK